MPSAPLADLLEQLDPARPETLAATDARGLLWRNRDTVETYRERVRRILDEGEKLLPKLADGAELKLFDTFPVTAADAIPAEIMNEAAQTTWGLYRFAINWVPGFFLRRGMGALWGGCAAIDPETFFTVFLVRHSFANSPHWFLYDRKELLAHELCHVARMTLDDPAYEEHFAYATAQSRLRRYMGNWFQTKWDAILFLLPVLILLAAESLRTFGPVHYPIWPFWLLALTYPGFLLVRNQRQRQTFFQAFLALRTAGCGYPAAVLFRCDAAEIAELARQRKQTPDVLLGGLRQKAQSSLKWQVIVYRFIDHPETMEMDIPSATEKPSGAEYDEIDSGNGLS